MERNYLNRAKEIKYYAEKILFVLHFLLIVSKTLMIRTRTGKDMKS